MMDECPHVEAFFLTIEGKKFIKEMNEILEDIEWRDDGCTN